MEPDFIGQISLFALGFAPTAYILCDGRTLGINNYTPLFALLGVAYGGDGTTNFKIPNLLGFEPEPNLHYCIAFNGLFPPHQ